MLANKRYPLQSVVLGLALAMSVGAAFGQEKPKVPAVYNNPGPLPEPTAGKVEQEPQPGTEAENPDVSSAYEDVFAQTLPISAIPSDFLERVAKSWQPKQHFQVSPGDSIMIPVGQGLMNTISTSLFRVNAKTNDETSAFEIDEGNLYVTVNTLNPISLIIYEDGVLESQISVTLVPIPAPPSMVDIDFELTAAMVAKSEAHHEKLKLEEAQQSAAPGRPGNTPYHQRITEMLTQVARGDVPRGFGLSKTIPHEQQFPCAMTIYHQAKQRLVSAKYMIDVVHVVNDSPRTYNVREEMCLSKYVMAVSLFQKAYLQPGEESEVYILRDVATQEREQQRNRRPRLIGG